MAVDYQKLYAYLVGQIDNTIQMADIALHRGKQDCNGLLAVRNTLEHALITAEDMYLSHTEDEQQIE